jgi:hypothetical protein
MCVDVLITRQRYLTTSTAVPEVQISLVSARIHELKKAIRHKTYRNEVSCYVFYFCILTAFIGSVRHGENDIIVRRLCDSFTD